MMQQVLWLLLPLIWNQVDSNVFLVKTIGSEELVTLCSGANITSVLMATCNKKTNKTNIKEVFQLHYYITDKSYPRSGDSTITFTMKNDTLLLYLNNLKLSDSGNYTCQCTYDDGFEELHVDLTVEGGKDMGDEHQRVYSSSAVYGVLAVVGLLVIAGGLIWSLHKRHHRNTHRSPEGAQDIQTPAGHQDTEFPVEFEPYNIFRIPVAHTQFVYS